MSYDLSKLLVSCHIFNYVIPYLIDDGKPFRSCVQSQKTSYRNEYCKTGFCLLTSLIRSKSDWMMNLCKDELVKQPRLIAQRLNTDKKKLYFQDDEIIFFFCLKKKTQQWMSCFCLSNFRAMYSAANTIFHPSVRFFIQA